MAERAPPEFMALGFKSRPARRPAARAGKRARNESERGLGYDADLHAFPAAPPSLLHQLPAGAPPLPRLPPWTQVARATFGARSRPTRAALLKLHEEIMEFWDMVRETKAEAEEAGSALEAMTEALHESNGPQAELRVFGSRVYGLALPWADWDVTIVRARRDKKATLTALAAALRRRSDFVEVQPILKARVPIVKCRHAATGIELDVSCGEASGCRSAAAVRGFVEQFPALVPLVLVLKHFLAQRDLNVTFQGGVGSFLLTCMVVHHLQMMRADVGFQTESTRDVLWAPGALAHEAQVDGTPVGAKPPRPSREERVAALPRASLNLGYLLFTFLEYFGRRFNYRQHAIVIAPEEGRVSKVDWDVFDPARPRLLSVFSPVDEGVDIGRNSYAVQGVQAAMLTAFLSLAEALDATRPPVGRANTAGARRRCLGTSPLSAVLAQDAKLRARADALCADAQARHAAAGVSAPGAGEASPSPARRAARDAEAASPSPYQPQPSAKRSRPAEADSGADDDDSDDDSVSVLSSGDDSDKAAAPRAASAGPPPAAGVGCAPSSTDTPRTEDQARRAVIAAAAAAIPAAPVRAAPAATRAILVPKDAAAAPSAEASATRLAGMVGRMRRPRLIADLLSGRRERKVEDEAATRGSWF